MSTLVFLGCLTLVSTVTAYAQPNRGKMQELKAQKRAFIQREAQLTDAEMKTWEGIQKANRPEGKPTQTEVSRPKPEVERWSQTSIEAMTESQANAVLTDRIAKAERAIALRKAAIESARQQLGAKKVLRIQLAEKQWRRELLKKIRDQKGGATLPEDTDDLD